MVLITIMARKSQVRRPFWRPWHRWGSCCWGESTSLNCGHHRLIARPPDGMWTWKAIVEWYWQGKIEKLEDKPLPVSLLPPKIPYGITRKWTRASAMRGRRLITWAMARPRWENNIKTDRTAFGYNDVNWLYTAQDRDFWQDLTNTVMNSRIT
jgi:hypothetical protein